MNMRQNAENDRPLAAKTAENIIAYILGRQLLPGDRLPNEQLLAQEVGVGRSSIREAMKLLASRNIVDIRQGSGTYVSAKQGVAEDPLGFLFVKDKQKLARDLMDIRFLLEPEIASMAARNASSGQICEIGRLCAETEALLVAKQDHTQKDVTFHTAIAMSSGNLVVPRLVPVINQSVELLIDITNSSLRSETVESHREIARAIAAHDAVAAKDAMYLHLVYNRRCLLHERRG